MRTEDVLKTANDTIAVSADEPLARSVEQYVEAMQRQYGFSEEEIRAAVDIAVLSQRQERMIDERIRAYIAQHPCSPGMDLNAYCAPLLNGVITVEQVSRQLKALDDAGERHETFAPAEERPAQSAPACHDDALIHSLRCWSKILWWGGIALALVLLAGGLGEHLLNQLYGSGLAFGYYSNGTAAQLAALWDFCLIFIRCLIAAAAGVTGSLILRALARQLEKFSI